MAFIFYTLLLATIAYGMYIGAVLLFFRQVKRFYRNKAKISFVTWRKEPIEDDDGRCPSNKRFVVWQPKDSPHLIKHVVQKINHNDWRIDDDDVPWSKDKLPYWLNLLLEDHYDNAIKADEERRTKKFYEKSKAN